MDSRIRKLEKTLLSDNWYTLNKYSFEYQRPDGRWEHQEREAYDRGNGATILLYNSDRSTVILTRQFRLPSFINSNRDGMLVTEVVLCTSGSITMHQEYPDGTVTVATISAGEYLVNDPGIWHTADVQGSATAVFITAGMGTEHRTR